MGLFGKGKKASWEMTGEGGYRFFLGDEEVTEDCMAAWYEEDHLVVYCEQNGTHYFLESISTQKPEDRQTAELITAENELIYIHDEEMAFNLYFRGRMVANEFPYDRTEKDLWLYNPEEESTFVLSDVEKVKPYTFVFPRFVSDDPNTGIFYTLKGDKYQFFFRGEDVSAEVKVIQSDADLLVYYPDRERTFLIRDENKMKKGTWQKDSFSKPDSVPLFKKVGEDKYRFYYKGKNRGGECNACKIGTHAVIFYPEETRHFWIDDGWELQIGSYQDAKPFAEGKKLLWYTNGRDYHIYFEGREVTREVQLQRYENNAIVMHEESMSMFQLEDFFTTSDSVVRAV